MECTQGLTWGMDDTGCQCERCRIVRAAPDRLEACKELMKELRFAEGQGWPIHLETHDAYQAAKAAIAKATR